MGQHKNKKLCRGFDCKTSTGKTSLEIYREKSNLAIKEGRYKDVLPLIKDFLNW